MQTPPLLTLDRELLRDTTRFACDTCYALNLISTTIQRRITCLAPNPGLVFGELFGNVPEDGIRTTFSRLAKRQYPRICQIPLEHLRSF
jgi:hypothetical protein